MDQFFDWYEMSDECRVWFVEMKLINAAKHFSIGVEWHLERIGPEPTTLWAEMKAKLREKYFSSTYKQNLFNQLLALKQGSFSVLKYMRTSLTDYLFIAIYERMSK